MISCWIGPEEKLSKDWICPDDARSSILISHVLYDGPRRKRKGRCRYCKKRIEFVGGNMGNLTYSEAMESD